MTTSHEADRDVDPTDDHFVVHTVDQHEALRFTNTETDETWDVALIDGRIVKVHARTRELFVVDRQFVRRGLLSPVVEYDPVALDTSLIDADEARQIAEQHSDRSRRETTTTHAHD